MWGQNTTSNQEKELLFSDQEIPSTENILEGEPPSGVAELSVATHFGMNLGHMLSSETISMVVGFISAYCYALLLGPDLMGVWQTASVILGYGAFLSLSLPFVMRRDFVTLRAEGKIQESVDLANQVFSYHLAIFPVASLGLVMFAVVWVHNGAFRWSLVAVAALLTINLFCGFGNILAKGLNDYKLLRDASLVTAAVTFATIPLVKWYGLKGLLWGVILTAIVSSVYYYRRRHLPYRWHWNNRLLGSLVIVAAPLYLESISTTVFSSIDRFIIASALSFRDVGLFSLSNIAAKPVTILIGSSSLVLFTHLNARFGMDKDAPTVLKHVQPPQQVFSWLFPPLLGMGALMLPFFTKILLPNYVEGIRAAQISMFGVCFYAMASFTANGLFILDRQILSAISFIIAGLIKTGGNLLAVRLGTGIAGVAMTTLVAYIIYDELMLAFLYRHLRLNLRSFVVSTLEKLLPMCTIIGICYFLTHYRKEIGGRFGCESAASYLILSVVILLLLSVPFFLVGWNRLKMAKDSL